MVVLGKKKKGSHRCWTNARGPNISWKKKHANDLRVGKHKKIATKSGRKKLGDRMARRECGPGGAEGWGRETKRPGNREKRGDSHSSMVKPRSFMEWGKKCEFAPHSAGREDGKRKRLTRRVHQRGREACGYQKKRRPAELNALPKMSLKPTKSKYSAAKPEGARKRIKNVGRHAEEL